MGEPNQKDSGSRCTLSSSLHDSTQHITQTHQKKHYEFSRLEKFEQKPRENSSTNQTRDKQCIMGNSVASQVRSAMKPTLVVETTRVPSCWLCDELKGGGTYTCNRTNIHVGQVRRSCDGHKVDLCYELPTGFPISRHCYKSSTYHSVTLLT